MNNGFLGFVIGAAVGSLVTYFVVKNKIQQQADDDISEMRSYLRERLSEGSRKPSDAFKEVPDTSDKPKFEGSVKAQNELKEKILNERYNYAEVSREEDSEEEGGDSPVNKRSLIYEIAPGEYDADNEHDKISLTWFLPQHILADDEDKRMSFESIGGEDMLKDFGPDDVKYVRNDATSTDYEIVLDDVNTWVDPEAEE